MADERLEHQLVVVLQQARNGEITSDQAKTRAESVLQTYGREQYERFCARLANNLALKRQNEQP